MVYGVQDPQAMYNKYGINGFYNQYGLYNNNQSPSVFGYGYNQGNADDGKISFGEKVGSFFKGIGKSIVNGVKSIFTPKGLLTTALTIGACMIPGVGPLIGMGLAVVGVAKGAVSVAKGAAAAASAQTDEQAKQAWENIGGGTFTTAMSVVGVKGAAKAIGNMNKAACGSTLKDAASLTDKLSGTWKNATNTFKNSKLGTSVTNVGRAFKDGSGMDKVKNAWEAGKTEVKTAWEKHKVTSSANKAARNAANDATKTNNAIARNNETIRSLKEQINNCDDAAQIEKFQQQIDDLTQQNTKLAASADDIADRMQSVESIKATKEKFKNSYEQQADGSYKLKDTAKDSGYSETLTAEQYTQQLKNADDLIAKAKPTSGSSIQNAQKNVTNAEKAIDDLNAEYASGKTELTGQQYSDRLKALEKNLETARADLSAAKTNYANAQQAVQERAKITNQYNKDLKDAQELLKTAKKNPNATKRAELIKEANKKIEDNLQISVDARADVGARMNRLELTKNRVENSM
ncbi:hypothetical protein IKA15_03895, partial [bacterium]|nr:hypothetical protein [bacterium]